MAGAQKEKKSEENGAPHLATGRKKTAIRENLYRQPY